MKKISAIFLSLLICAASVSAQVLPSVGIKNTLWSGFGRPYPEYVNNQAEDPGIRFYGLHETLQANAKVWKLSVEGMLNWGALTHYNGINFSSFTFLNTTLTPFYYTNHTNQGSWWTNGETESYYVNFLVNPLDGLNLGMGTRLDWKIGPAPASMGHYWDPYAHIVQGGLKDALPHPKFGSSNGADVVGYSYYANNYTSCYILNTRASLGARYRYKDIFQVGAAIPSGVTTNNMLFNAAVMIKPMDLFAASFAYEGIFTSHGNLYTGLSLYLAKNFTIDAYLAIDNLDYDNSDEPDSRWGTGASITWVIPEFHITLKPEAGFTFYEDPHSTFAWYAGGRADITLAKRFVVGGWISWASGASDKRWHEDTDENRNKGYYHPDWNGGFIFDVRPDITFILNERHSFTVFTDFQSRTKFNGDWWRVWCAGLYWTYRR